MTWNLMISNKESPFISRDMFKGFDMVKKVNEACDKKSESSRNICPSPEVGKQKYRIKSAILKPANIKQQSMDDKEFRPFNFKQKESETSNTVLKSPKRFFMKKNNISGGIVDNSQGVTKRVFVLPNGKKFYNFTKEKEE